MPIGKIILGFFNIPFFYLMCIRTVPPPIIWFAHQVMTIGVHYENVFLNSYSSRRNGRGIYTSKMVKAPQTSSHFEKVPMLRILSTKNISILRIRRKIGVPLV